MSNDELIKRARDVANDIKSQPLTEAGVLNKAAHADEAANLLEQMADRLKQIEEWARWKCRGGTCGVSRAERGAHRNGCPVVELGLDQESDQ